MQCMGWPFCFRGTPKYRMLLHSLIIIGAYFLSNLLCSNDRKIVSFLLAALQCMEMSCPKFKILSERMDVYTITPESSSFFQFTPVG